MLLYVVERVVKWATPVKYVTVWFWFWFLRIPALYPRSRINLRRHFDMFMGLDCWWSLMSYGGKRLSMLTWSFRTPAHFSRCFDRIRRALHWKAFSTVRLQSRCIIVSPFSYFQKLKPGTNFFHRVVYIHIYICLLSYLYIYIYIYICIC